MRRYFLFILTAIISVSFLHAQDVWKEGTRWEVECYDQNITNLPLSFAFELNGHFEIDGIDYLKLVDLKKNKTIACIRTERGDTVVYARYLLNNDLSEFVLYDFGSFEPDTYFQYTTWDEASWDDGNPIYTLETDTVKEEGLTYYHDVITDGDILPCWNQVLFKVGCLDGPMAYLYDPNFEPTSDPLGNGKKPKRRNVSHTVLRLSDRTVEFLPDGIISVIVDDSPEGDCYNLQGMRVKPRHPGIYIINGKKFVK